MEKQSQKSYVRPNVEMTCFNQEKILCSSIISTEAFEREEVINF